MRTAAWTLGVMVAVSVPATVIAQRAQPAVQTSSARATPRSNAGPVVGDANAYAPEVLRMAQRTVLGLRSCARGVNRAYPGTLAHAQEFTITVRPNGTVEDLVIAPNDAVTARLRACLVPVVQRWQLRAPATRMTLSYSMARLRDAFGAYHFTKP